MLVLFGLQNKTVKVCSESHRLKFWVSLCFCICCISEQCASHSPKSCYVHASPFFSSAPVDHTIQILCIKKHILKKMLHFDWSRVFTCISWGVPLTFNKENLRTNAIGSLNIEHFLRKVAFNFVKS